MSSRRKQVNKKELSKEDDKIEENGEEQQQDVLTSELKEMSIKVPSGHMGERLDTYLTRADAGTKISRSQIQKLIKMGGISINGKPTEKLGIKVKGGDIIKVLFPSNNQNNTTQNENNNNAPSLSSITSTVVSTSTTEIKPEPMDLTILYEDEHIVVLNKDAGVMVHPSPGHFSGTLVNGLLHRYGKLSNGEGEDRPGIVHRLDRDTAGLMVVARTDDAHKVLKDFFQNRKLVKQYQAIVVGKVIGTSNRNNSNDQNEEEEEKSNPTTVINKPIGRHPKDINKMVIDLESGKEALTEFSVEKEWQYKKENFSLLDVRIHTGRTHQIRVHLSSIGTPIVGDPIYCKRHNRHQTDYLMLVSKFLQFNHPITGQPLQFEIEAPPHMKEFMQRK